MGKKEPEEKKKAGRGGTVPPAEKRWETGQSGNPKGRPRGSVSLMARLNARLREAILSGDKDLADAVVDSMVRAIIKDPVKAWPILREFIQRDEGSIAQALYLSGRDGGPITLEGRYEEFAAHLKRLAEQGKGE